MKNEYEIRGQVTAIKLNRGLETLVDTQLLEKVSSIPGRWTADKNYKSNSYYVKTQIMTKGINKTITLHRLVMDAPKGLVVDHFNRNTLDNTIENLRVVDHASNSQNAGLAKTNTTGFRGVSPYRNRRALFAGYRAAIMVNGVRKTLGHFKSASEAAEACFYFCQANGVPYPHTLEEIRKNKKGV